MATTQPSVEGSTRIATLDVLRAVAAIGVLLGHAYTLGGRSVPAQAEHWYDVLLIHTTTGVWLFFVISGYVISRPFIEALLSGGSLPQANAYALKRITRIFPIYLLALTAYLALEGLQGTNAWLLPFHFVLLHNLVPGHQTAILSVAWTLTLEVLFYVAVPVVAMLLRTRREQFTAASLSRLVAWSWLASVAFSVVADLISDPLYGEWLRGSFPAMWAAFCPGLLLAIAFRDNGARVMGGPLRRLLASPARLAVLALVVAAVGTLCIALTPTGSGAFDQRVVTDFGRQLSAIGYGLLVAAVLTRRPHAPAWTVQLGLVSYGIYLYHPVLLALFRRWDPSPFLLWKGGAGALMVHIAVLLGATLVCAFASWRWIEAPIIQRTKNVTARWVHESERSADASFDPIASPSAL